MEEITPVQREQLKTWAGQRDALLSEISTLRTEKEVLEKTNKELANSATEITATLNQVLGRIMELKKKEEELVTLKSNELAGLESDKVRLESDIVNLGKVIEILSKQKTYLEHDIECSTEVLKKVDGQVSDLEKIVDHVTRVSADNKHEVESLANILKKTLGEMITVCGDNVVKTRGVLSELPQLLVEIRRIGLERTVIKKHKI